MECFEGDGVISFFRKLKAIVFFSLFLLLSLVVMFIFSLFGEKKYLENCHDLGIPCEEGFAHRTQDYAEQQLNKWLNKAKQLEIWKKS